MTKVVRFTTPGFDALLAASTSCGYKDQEVLNYLKFVSPLAESPDAKLINLAPYSPKIELDAPIIAAPFETALHGSVIQIDDVLSWITELRAEGRIEPDSHGAEKTLTRSEDQIPSVDDYSPSELDIETAQAVASDAEAFEAAAAQANS